MLPLGATSSPVDIDLINDILRCPTPAAVDHHQRVGHRLTGRGESLNEVIQRANPALRETDKVLKVLAGQNRTLAQLAVNSDTVLEPPLARARARWPLHRQGERDRAGDRRAPRRPGRARPEKLPALPQPAEADDDATWGRLADEMTPVISDLGDAAPGLNRFILALGPFSRHSEPALRDPRRRGRGRRAGTGPTEPTSEDLATSAWRPSRCRAT